MVPPPHGGFIRAKEEKEGARVLEKVVSKVHYYIPPAEISSCQIKGVLVK